jgi:hypothetical protein
MAKKKQITISDNTLFLQLKDLYESKSYIPEDKEYRETFTAIEIRKRLPESFVFESGVYLRSKKVIEIEGRSQIITIRSKTAKEEYYELKGIPLEQPSNEKLPVDPEIKYRKTEYKPKQEIVTCFVQTDELQF